ncbi:hypothetical protein RhiJN_15041 [Ceratobasidium sp. AG-Ba]|nr:hypothetical protein RhiJN_15041 [Ceratobasidium sp. AG-Ba]
MITEDCTTVRFLLSEFIELYALWQGIDGPIIWETGDEEYSDPIRLINPRRLPEGVSHLIDPYLMNEETLWAMVTHITLGQRGRVPEDNSFSLLGDMTREEDTGCRRWKHDQSTLVYGPASWLYVARCINKAPGDVLARMELANMLPPTPDERSKYHPFTELDQKQLFKMAELNARVAPLILAYSQYEAAGPVSPPIEYYDTLNERCPHIPKRRPMPQAYLGHFPDRWLSKEFWDRSHVEHKEFSYHKVSEFLRSEHLTHEPTKTVFGGPYGVKWVVLVVIRMDHNVRLLEDTTDRPPVIDPTFPILKQWRADVDTMILYLTNRIERSRLELSELRQPIRGGATERRLDQDFKLATYVKPPPIVEEMTWFRPPDESGRRTTIVTPASSSVAEVQQELELEKGSRGDEEPVRGIPGDRGKRPQTMSVELPARRAKTPRAMLIDTPVSGRGTPVEDYESEDDHEAGPSRPSDGSAADADQNMWVDEPGEGSTSTQHDVGASGTPSPARKRRRFGAPPLKSSLKPGLKARRGR